MSSKADVTNTWIAGRLIANDRTHPNKLIRNASKDGVHHDLDGRKYSQPGIDPLSQVRFSHCHYSSEGGADDISIPQHIIKRANTSNMLPAHQQRSHSGAPSDEPVVPEPTAPGHMSVEPVIARADTSNSGLKDKKYVILVKNEHCVCKHPQMILRTEKHIR